MDFISTGTEILKQENVLTPRQKDIIDMTKKIIVDYPFEWNVASIENRKRWLESKFFEIMDI